MAENVSGVNRYNSVRFSKAGLGLQVKKAEAASQKK
jgi:hypothetical protein